MLIEFRVENHRSLRGEQVLGLEATRPDSGDPRARSVGREALLPVAALYGANASGKSNVLAALRFMRDAVVHSHRFWSPDGGVPRDPFAWGEEGRKPSLYEVAFLLGEVRAEYGFVVDDTQVLEEWLYVWPLGRKQLWFERDRSEFTFGEHLTGEKRLLESITRPNSLFLSVAVQNKHEQLQPIFRWFRALRSHGVPGVRGESAFLSPRPERFFSSWLRSESPQVTLLAESEVERASRLDRFRDLLRAADVGIVGLKLESDDDIRAEGSGRNAVLLQHKSSTSEAWLPLEQESHGTKQLFRLAPLVLETLEDGGVLLVDELEASFHPLLALQVVQLFNAPRTNPRRAQLVFSTHDTNLLGTTLGEPALRRDQVWLTEKDAEGATALYPLTDYKPRKAENLERGYLQGRYGAIPFLGELAKVTSK